METHPSLADRFAGLRATPTTPNADTTILSAALCAMIAAIFARIFGRLEQILQLWQSGQCAPPSRQQPTAPRAISGQMANPYQSATTPVRPHRPGLRARRPRLLEPASACRAAAAMPPPHCVPTVTAVRSSRPHPRPRIHPYRTRAPPSAMRHHTAQPSRGVAKLRIIYS